MGNNFRWFKHDNDASEDIFIRSIEAEFGHFGYAAYFKTLEVLSRQGDGDNLLITPGAYARKLGTRTDVARKFLTSVQLKGKCSFQESAGMLHIQVKKFSEKQDRRQKNRTPIRGSLSAVKEVDREKERDNGTEGGFKVKEGVVGGDFLGLIQSLSKRLSFGSKNPVREISGGEGG